MTASVITSTVQETAYETGREMGRTDRHFGIYAPHDYHSTWKGIPGFLTGYDIGWTELDRTKAVDIASMPDTPEAERFELEIDRAEAMSER